MAFTYMKAVMILWNSFWDIPLTSDVFPSLPMVESPVSFSRKWMICPNWEIIPALTVEQAKEALLQGQYSDGPSTPPKEENIHQVQLVYRTAASPYYVPCYVFYVLIEKEQRRWDLVPDEAQEYVPYYVPAVDHRYILDLPAL